MADQLSFVSVEKLAAAHKAQAGLCPHAMVPGPKDHVHDIRFCQEADRITCNRAEFGDPAAFGRCPFYLRHELYAARVAQSKKNFEVTL
ncbi:hypothetical protein [Candidatus Bathycorpusculum sp.]|uniref:hypothetical protein n=1 Tax=Candidatus Bathycorpusculum sp. TaxID=2994959 RepID=UPI002838FB0F|nr:hypothetical protein [Candidatus Termitimicrobium sp.]MCL2432079.1 hypothetical protein [Candidatus Termitimicrobium sp.]